MKATFRRRAIVWTAAVLVAAAAGAGIVMLLQTETPETPEAESPHDEGLLTAPEVEERTIAFLGALDQAEGRPSDEVLEFPTPTHKRAALELVVGLVGAPDSQMRWEAGVEENIGLDLWECAWLDYAHEAYRAGDMEEFARAGETILLRAEFPRQRSEKNPDVDRSMNEFAAPMGEGLWERARERYIDQCPGVDSANVAR